MRIRCTTCNTLRPGAQLSLDCATVGLRQFRDAALRVRFLDESEPVDEIWLSPEFVAAERITVGDLPTPEDNLSWVNKLRVLCKVCYDRVSQ
jgi:hypothetical protein